MCIEDEVGSCSVPSCPNEDNFRSNLILREMCRLSVCYGSESGTIQSSLDDMFGTFSDSTSSDCGATGNSNRELTGGDRFHHCEGQRRIKKKIFRRPQILEISPTSKTGNPEKEVTCGDEMEMYITIHGEKYKLVGALLNNQHHYRSLTPVHGKFLRYDGMLQNRKAVNYLRWLRPHEPFGKGYKAVVFWYVLCEHLSQEMPVGGELSAVYV